MDLDGTLLRDDGSIATTDRHAIARARAAGIVVTIATGRLPASTLPTGRSLNLTGPIVCGDGAVVVACPSGEVLQSAAIPSEACARIMERGTAAGLAAFFLTPNSLLTRPAHVALGESLRGFSENLQTFEGLAVRPGDAATLPASSEPFIAGFLVGSGEAVRRMAETIRAEQQAMAVVDVEAEAFGLGESGLWAIRLRGAQTSKASGLAQLCIDLGITHEQVAVVGDWYNDMSMLAWARHSFVMAGAPPEVAALARTRLIAQAGHGGGVAELVNQLLGPAAPSPLSQSS